MDVRHLVIVGEDPHPSRANGLHHVACRLAREQLAMGERAELVFLTPPGREKAAGAEVPARYPVLRGLRVLGRVVHLSGEATEEILRDAGPDTFIHIHGGREPLLFGFCRELRRRGIPYGITIHGRYSHLFDSAGHVKRWIPTLYVRMVERHILEGAAFVHATAPTEHRHLRRLAPHARLVTIPNAGYSSRFDGKLAPPEREMIAAPGPVFGFCGRYEICHKGLDLLLEGFARYRGAGGRGRLELIGTGPGREDVAALARTLGVQDAVLVQGPLFGADKLAAFRTWDYFAQPARFDGLPIGCLEAALHGLPLLVTYETGLGSVVNRSNAGVVVEALTADAVAAAMAIADRQTPDQWRTMSANAYRMALSVGDWTVIAERMSALYRTPGIVAATDETPFVSSLFVHKPGE